MKMTITKKKILRLVRQLPSKIDIDVLIERLYVGEKKKIDWNKDPLTKAIGSVHAKHKNTSTHVDEILYGRKKAA